MRESDNKKASQQRRVLTQEQDALLDLYTQNLDNYFEAVKASEKIQVEIETLHLKRILSK
ncbi:hypothetical protein [Pontibacter beigongshangensis]|uniref:hypothetical protein n=1 Tax=Pontibacter beigongshangensis TaxID=2574733 RepID=UPI00164F1013|nr:hypothetical protein [Pontibacter beigongshangensis]